MNAIVLAAGKGIRLLPFTEHRPKCLLEINNIPIIQRTLEQLGACGIERAVVVAGHYAELVESKVKELAASLPSLAVDVVVNPVYYKTGTIYSLWLAREWTAGGFLLVEGDVICDLELMRRLVEHPSDDVLVVDSDSELGEEEMKVFCGPQGLERISKVLIGEECYGEYVGLAKFGPDGAQTFMQSVGELIQDGRVSEFYEAAIERLLPSFSLELMGVEGARWTEIDYIDEYLKAREIFLDEPHQPVEVDFAQFEAATRLSPSISSLCGGTQASYLKDFCFLANPYFPPAGFINELMLSFVSLVKHYPSMQPRLTKLLAETFDIDSAHLVVGNGASELITVVAQQMVDELLVPIPTWDRYLEVMEAVGKKTHYFRLTEDEGFAVRPKELEVAVKKSRVNALLLINPNNPTGVLTPLDELLELADRLRELELIIVDESFIDFAGEDVIPTIIPHLADLPNVIVITSMGKTYGMPGLRLGYVVTRNEAHLHRIRAAMPVWNVNALGEYFIELLPKYKTHYEETRRKVIHATRRLTENLAALPGMAVFPGKANFVLTKVTTGESATSLRNRLLTQHRIYVRDCSNRVGLSDTFLRIAARTEGENDELVSLLSVMLRESRD